jgi:hypothetical protein
LLLSSKNFSGRALGGHLVNRAQRLLFRLWSLGYSYSARVAQASLQIRDPRLKLLDATPLASHRLE